MRLGILPILGLIFVTLKLAGPIAHWSWWLVLSPFIAMSLLLIIWGLAVSAHIGSRFK